MEPKTNHKLDKDAFRRLKGRIGDFATVKRRRAANPMYAVDIPHEISLQLTYACNLRCKMCYQWSDDGYFNSYGAQQQKMEIDADIFSKILGESHAQRSSLYLWGGEPLYHANFPDIAKALESDPRYTTICTNGLLIERNMESLLRISQNLALLFSIDGLYETNNQMRGNKTFERVIKQITLLLDEQRKGNYKGTISINAVLNDDLAPKIVEFVEFFESLGVDSVYFNYPWYISEERALKMDHFYATNLAWLNTGNSDQKMSWHSFTFKLNPASAAIIQNQIAELKKRTWNIRIRFQQHMEGERINEFILDTITPNRSCFAYSTRIEILSNGRVGTCCKFFPELSVGNIKERGLIELWKSDSFNKLRSVLSKDLLPVCAKCILLYRNGTDILHSKEQNSGF